MRENPYSQVCLSNDCRIRASRVPLGDLIGSVTEVRNVGWMRLFLAREGDIGNRRECDLFAFRLIKAFP